MKRAVILHGTDGNPAANWFPWLRSELKSAGYEVWVPELPENHTPNRENYNNFLFGSGRDFSDNLVIGHSSGAVSVLNLLADNRCPKIDVGILVGAWAKMDETDLDHEQFKDLFPSTGFDFEKIRQNTKKLIYIHGDNDPYCPLDQAKWLAEQTKSEIVIIPNGHHLGSVREPEFPELIKLLKKHDLL